MKFDLLKLISEIYEKDINIVEDYSVKIDRTLNCKRFIDETGFKPNDWQKLIKNMYLFK